MGLKSVFCSDFAEGDLVTVKSMPQHDYFCIIGFKYSENAVQPIAVLKALFNNTYIIEKPVSELNSLLVRGIL